MPLVPLIFKPQCEWPYLRRKPSHPKNNRVRRRVAIVLGQTASIRISGSPCSERIEQMVAAVVIFFLIGLLGGNDLVYAFAPKGSFAMTRVSSLSGLSVDICGSSSLRKCKTIALKAQETSGGWLELENGENSPPRLLYGSVWVLLTIYAFNFAPGGSAAAAAIDLELAKKMISTPFDGSGSAIFAAVFNSLGILPAVYGALLLPGGKRQKIPALAFVTTMFAGGFFAIGPYLALRNYRTDVTKSTRGRGSGAFESKITGLLLTTFALWLAYYAVFSGNFGAACREYSELFWTQRIVHVSTIDAIILSLFVAEPMREDMARRGFEGPSAGVLSAIPILGPSIYLLLRPPLPED